VLNWFLILGVLFLRSHHRLPGGNGIIPSAPLDTVGFAGGKL
jgi:hypothetical protein